MKLNKFFERYDVIVQEFRDKPGVLISTPELLKAHNDFSCEAHVFAKGEQDAFLSIERVDKPTLTRIIQAL